ncbi:MAG: wax ester/triacylglycerol synthase family O-acyltransferase [Haliea sp.]|nr:wax ester/triacylglycerol synthase family O-acyltransferase [Haliea sp.]
MRRMGGADAFMLAMETPRAYMHTFKVAIIDPSTDPQGWCFEKFHRDFEQRAHLVPFLRWKYADAPLGLNHPLWLEDEDFNLDYHVRRVALPQPADHKALCEFMGSVYAYQLDRSRPLWKCWVVEGVEGGKVALVTMLHHAYVDGAGASYGLEQLYRDTPGCTPEHVPPWQARPTPSWLKQLWLALRDWPALVLGGLPKVISGLRQKKALERQYAEQGKPPHPAPSMMQQTPINRVLSYGRTFVCDSMPFADFKAISKGLGVTINDVFLCCAAGALRQMFLDGHYDPDDSPLIAATPFAGKRPEGMEGLGNFVTMDYCWLHTDIADPLERLHAGHKAANEMKEHLKKSVEMNADFSAVMKIMPPWAVKAFSWWLREKKQGSLSLFGNVALSNVPGPRKPLYWDNYKLANWFSTGQIIDGTCINMTMWSYCDFVNLCILADKKVLPDGWKLFGYFKRELETLVSLTPQHTEQEKLAS